MQKPIKLARLFADGKPRVVVFQKKDGTWRTMYFRYEGQVVRLPYMVVHDLQKNATRQLNLATVQGAGFVVSS